jgi:hypothetical protein
MTLNSYQHVYYNSINTCLPTGVRHYAYAHSTQLQIVSIYCSYNQAQG